MVYALNVNFCTIGGLLNQPRATTAVGISEMETKKSKMATPNGRRMLSSAHAGKRRKLRTQNIADGMDKLGEEDHFAQTLNSNFMSNGEDISHKFHTTNEFDKVENRPPSRQKEPSLALGIGSEYGEGDDEDSGRITSEIVLTTGIPAPTTEFNSNFVPAQVMSKNENRPPSRQKTPSKAVGLDDPDDPHVDPIDVTNGRKGFIYNKGGEPSNEVNPRIMARKAAKIDPKSKLPSFDKSVYRNSSPIKP